MQLQRICIYTVNKKALQERSWIVYDTRCLCPLHRHIAKHELGSKVEQQVLLLYTAYLRYYSISPYPIYNSTKDNAL